MLILGSLTYGAEGSSTLEELVFAKEAHKPLLVLKLCHHYKRAEVRLRPRVGLSECG